MSLPGGAYQGSAFTTVRGDVFIPEIWSGEIKRFRDANFIMADTCKKLPFVGKKGDKVHIPGISRLSVNDKIAETPVQLQARTESEFTMIIDKYKEVSIFIEDILRLQASYELMSPYTTEIGYALSRDIDNFILGQRAVINSLVNGVASQRIYNSSTGLVGGTPLSLSKAAILAGKQIMDESDVPMNRHLAVSPGQYNDLLTITEFTSADFGAGTATQTGKVGTVYGLDVRMSSNITVNSATGYVNGTGAPPQPTPGFAGSPYLPTQLPAEVPTLTSLDAGYTSALLYHSDWCILAVQKNPSVESSRENLLQGNAMVSTQVYGAKVYRPDHAVIINTAP
jgi:Phage capsid protein